MRGKHLMDFTTFWSPKILNIYLKMFISPSFINFEVILRDRANTKFLFELVKRNQINTLQREEWHHLFFFFLRSLRGEIAGEGRKGSPSRFAETELCLRSEPKVFLLWDKWYICRFLLTKSTRWIRECFYFFRSPVDDLPTRPWQMNEGSSGFVTSRFIIQGKSKQNLISSAEWATKVEQKHFLCRVNSTYHLLPQCCGFITYLSFVSVALF